MLKTSVSRWSRIEANVWEVLIAVLAVSAVLTYVLAPESFGAAATRLAYGNWAYLWLVGYGLGGTAILVGIWSFRFNLEAFGLVLFATSVAINAVAVVSVFGLGFLPATSVHAATIGACLVTIRRILRRKVVVVLSEGKAAAGPGTILETD